MPSVSTLPPSGGASNFALPRRWRITKIFQLLHLFWQGWRTVARRFPSFTPEQQRQAIQQWAQSMLDVLEVSVDTQGLAAHQGAALVVSNHLSWLDILVILAHKPGVFVAKTEVKRWPLIGPLAAAVSTIFVDRGTRRSAQAMVDLGARSLAQGWPVVVFPEGTSSDGQSVGSFHANIFECAIRAGTPVQTLGLRYVDRHTQQIASAAHFIGDTTLATSLMRVLGQSTLHAQVHSGTPIAVEGHSRKSLAQVAHRQIRNLLAACTLVTAGATMAQTAAPELAVPVPSNAPALSFKDFFQTDTKSGRLQLTDTLQQANGKTMRLTGYMVQQETQVPGRFMLTTRPVQMSEHADGDADDLPVNWVMVYLDPSQQNFAVPHVRGLVELSGVVSVGRLEETDGRVSWVRLQLGPEATRAMNPFEVANYVHSLQHIH